LLKWLKNNAVGTYLLTRRGELVGEDEFGNRYYRARRKDPKGNAEWRTERRWVVYAGDGEIEASTVPPGWNGWLHHNFEKPPSEAPLPEQRWEKEHTPNLTGTQIAYLPPGHELRGGQRDKAVGDYEAWRP
jgi:NADH:ubiquinone oxidoreductase subunit